MKRIVGVGLLVLLGLAPLAAPASAAGMWIERVWPREVQPGRTLHIYGDHFGRSRGGRIPAMVWSGNGRMIRLRTSSWSRRHIVAELPDRLRRGGYRVLIYYDDSYATSSNVVRVQVTP